MSALRLPIKFKELSQAEEQIETVSEMVNLLEQKAYVEAFNTTASLINFGDKTPSASEFNLAWIKLSGLYYPVNGAFVRVAGYMIGERRLIGPFNKITMKPPEGWILADGTGASRLDMRDKFTPVPTQAGLPLDSQTEFDLVWIEFMGFNI